MEEPDRIASYSGGMIVDSCCIYDDNDAERSLIVDRVKDMILCEEFETYPRTGSLKVPAIATPDLVYA